jgi:two-component system, NarL family, response regulator
MQTLKPVGNLIRLLIVDDHPVVCTGLTSMLSAQPGMEVLGAASGGEEALEMIRQLQPNIILLDLRMPGMDGIGVLNALKRLDNPPRVLVLTSFEKEEDIYRAIRAGAHGYLLKDATKPEMIAAVTAVMDGKRYIPRHIAARLADRMMRSDLTSRELQILELLAQGSTNKEIATALQISDNTVRNHVNNIMDKLQVSDRTLAVVTAMRCGVLSEND